jgi:hypothetical protein
LRPSDVPTGIAGGAGQFNLRSPSCAVPMAGMVTRRRWQCPKCGSRWDIPTGTDDPKECPKCEQRGESEPGGDYGQRDFEGFATRLSAESPRRGNSKPKPTGTTSRERPAVTAAVDEPFFVSLPPDSPSAIVSPIGNSVVGRMRKQRSGLPLAIAATCAAGCLLLIGFVVVEGTKGHNTAAKAVQANGPSAGPLARAIEAVLPSEDPDLVAVRVWLKENLNVPEWEEVRWWPRRDETKWYRDSSPNIDWSKAPPAEPVFICRLKYRTKNEQGATVILDHTFQIKDGKAFRHFPDFQGGPFPD